ncbi:MAG: 5'/3'-nucleotidase SurE [Desulfurococcales archaeon]|nr:5'/3'-nucleotidase SurE [Desulfurococcales archaeon]
MGRHKILLVNDDGFMSKGLPLTYSALQDVGDVTAVVPEVPKSGGGHSVTLHKPIFVRELQIYGMTTYVINGTPVDAIHVARSVLGLDPDLVVSGVNIGENTSMQNILYSGTVEAAIEAGLFGYPSLSFSADVGSDEAFEDPRYAALVRKVVIAASAYILEHGWFKGIDCISINIPSMYRVRGAIMARAQKLRFIQKYEKRVDPRGREYYWLVGERVTEPETDSHYLSQGYVVVTPLRSDLTHPGLSGCLELPGEIHDFINHLDKVLTNLSRNIV